MRTILIILLLLVNCNIFSQERVEYVLQNFDFLENTRDFTISNGTYF